MSIRTCGIGLALTVGLVTDASGQTSLSATPAERLSRLLQERKLQHVAAVDPKERGRYVAAMRVGDSMVLLVTARYSAPVLLNERLFRGDHAGAYLELNGAADKDGKLFVQDLGAPGLHASREADKAFDIVYEAGAQRTAFDGDWKAQGMSKEDYLGAFREADGRYAHALEALLTALDERSEGETVQR
jgi:hypothetical protein